MLKIKESMAVSYSSWSQEGEKKWDDLGQGAGFCPQREGEIWFLF